MFAGPLGGSEGEADRRGLAWLCGRVPEHGPDRGFKEKALFWTKVRGWTGESRVSREICIGGKLREKNLTFWAPGRV